MNQHSQNDPKHSSSPHGAPNRKPIGSLLAKGLILAILAVTVYSIYVAVHEPDPQETVFLGQTKLASASPAAFRILVRHRATGSPVQNAKVGLNLSSKFHSTINLGTFYTGADGSLGDNINIPDLPPGSYQLTVDVSSRLGRDKLIEKMEVQHAVRILLSSDKPIYQPGQTIRLRSLVSNTRTQAPFTNEPVTFEVSDPKGNKVFKETHKVSSFGIASADFVLASELNLGNYTIRAISGTATTESSIQVKRYVLPKFKVNITTDKTYYLPGYNVAGKIQVKYFFGKPVANASVKLKVTSLQEKSFAAFEIPGTTDSSGNFSFQFVAPDFFAGMPQNNLQAFLDLNVEVTDTAGHQEQTASSLTVTQSELDLAVVPDGGRVVPGVENLLYVLTTYPDGQPAICKVFLAGASYQSDAQGVCVIKFFPAEINPLLELQALDNTGKKARLNYYPEVKADTSPLLLRTDKAIYDAGQSANLTILSTNKNNTVFIDVIRDGQMVLTKSVVLKNHQAQYSLPLPTSLVGVLKIHAYLITDDGDDLGLSRIIYINPTSNLKIQALASKPVYRPGEVAKVELSVTDAQGRPAPSALGISAVDESVFALHGNHPGLLQHFLDAESDLLKPRFQLKSFSDPSPLLLGPAPNQTLAQAYFSSLESEPPNPAMENLIGNDQLPRKVLDHVRSMRGTPDYERLRKDPYFAGILQRIENGVGYYDLREATGPSKLRIVESKRKAYFHNLKGAVLTIAGAALFLLLMFLVLRSAYSGEILMVVAILAIIAILAGLLMPALAKAKQKASRISLINDLKQIDLANRMAEEDRKDAGGANSAPRVRRDFPETLFWQPQLITDDQGKASLEIPLADSITTWRTTIDAVDHHGKLGGTELPIAVFQDFFVDLDLPVSLSLNDEVSMSVTCYNYLNESQDIHLKLAHSDWFYSPSAEATLHLGPNEVKSVHFSLKTLRVGTHSLRVTAKGRKLSDAIEREIKVLPTGDQIELTKNDFLKDGFTSVFNVPATAIPGSQSLWLKFYPSRFSEIVEGLDGILEAPHGCFEQTSSTTYPNVLVLEYLKRMGRLTPATELKAKSFINEGYQRLISFEVPGGGFEWFGHTPAHVGLTAYGILEFKDMSRVHPVDQALIDRTVKWLSAQQMTDGSWSSSAGLDSWSKFDAVTPYVAWALAEAGDNSQNLEKALAYLQSHENEFSTVYAKALVANAFLAHDRADSYGRKLAAELKQTAHLDNNKSIHWTSAGTSLSYSRGADLEVETSALCAMALMKAGLWPESVKQALTWISAHKTRNGTWGSTQATILAMRALIEGSTTSLGQEFDSTVTLSSNGKPIHTFHLNKQNSDVMQQIDLTKYLRSGENRIDLHQVPAGELPFQLTGVYWLPSSPSTIPPKVAETGNPQPLEIVLNYDRTTLAVNDQLQCTATVKNSSGSLINMAIIDLSIPPGFEVDSSDFQSLLAAGKIEKFEATANQVVLYLRELSASVPFTFSYSLRARYPLRIQTSPSTVYEYYQSRNRAQSRSITLEVAKE
ncbi:MG2 domain-containing protein [Pedosphaera parvula]|uniref:Alpha-2-macroglobulin domain protein n=1 Tax=Pedosphaera parvula (strain Ellin514) TaxID=320771 RepID=B9XQ65_PEDPL|nr:MG2 domain-containing protein [Pedosphaera parvula]EEF57983.1 alpha-2-macroglobulin domain protein [Pedosphaera parvula Ellin514]